MRSGGRSCLAAGLACGIALVPSAALAEEPERTGWWNRASAAGTALPQPTTAEGDLRVANAPDGPAAFAAVSYPSAGATDAVLTLTLRPDRTLGTPDVLACPTTEADWAEGGNQPYAAAPAYDCETASAFGELAPDGSTLTFLLDSGTQDATGTWSLALVPNPGTTAPFSADVAKPEPDAFAASGGEEPFVSEPAPPPGEEPGGSSDPAGSGDAFLPGGFAAPPTFDAGSAQAPLVADGAAAPLPAAPEPAVAAPVAATPLLVARPAGLAEDLGSGRRLLALLVLAGGSAAVGYAAGQQRPGPRLIGGRSRAVVPTAAPAFAGPASAEERPRGIGRFAKSRDAAPRRLR